ncbi:hypothetical protein QGM71_16725 [Virgibacillus sp. C22-A2]|uniref:Uncharacterized protein n=1 Tax=Virgibacillus tibetensis TaxID=3042313 RepID=A0ABU6KL19_9BACI|nr:hypothetical protein [Virgibacillus sp. C22-A2]
MEEISSYKIQLNEKLQTKDVIKIYNYASKSDYNIYLYRENVIADAENLPKLLSFFFVTPLNNSLVMIVDGKNTHDGYEEVKSILDKTIQGEFRVSHKMHTGKSVVV